MERSQLSICNVQGRLFELASKNKYSSVQFISFFMNSKVAKELDSENTQINEIGEDCLLSALIDEVGDSLSKDGEVYPQTIMYWIGYIYRYWHYLYEESSEIIYSYASADTLRVNYLMFHTMDPEMAIDNLIEIKQAEEESKQAEFDWNDSGRTELGFTSLSHYADYLEQNFAESEFSKRVLDCFERINNFSGEYEDIYASYDDLISELSNDVQEERLISLEQSLAGLIDIPEDTEKPSSISRRVERIKEWANEKADQISEISENSLPDTIRLGESYFIEVAEDAGYELALDDYQGVPEPGETIFIYVNLFDPAHQTIATGYIEMTVGYLETDDEGNIGNGVSDSIDYYCGAIIESLEDVYNKTKERLLKEKTIADVIKQF